MSGDDPLAAQRLAAMRRQYTAAGLHERDLAPTWLEQLRGWLGDAAQHGILEPNAMVLATAGASCTPSVRTVLLKGLDEHGLVFFTNYASDKGRDLEANPQGALLFPWHALQRQVHVQGIVQRLAAADSDAYWASRPRGSQIGAAASAQSQVLGGRHELEAAARELERRHEGAAIPRPAHWGGYRLAPLRVEFWQGRADRLHDRLRYRQSEDAAWAVERLAP